MNQRFGPLTYGTLLGASLGLAVAAFGLYLRIRAGEETADRLVRWETGYFSLDPASLELVALIGVPR